MTAFSEIDLHDAELLEFVVTSHANFFQDACLSVHLVNGKKAKLVFENCFSIDASFSQWIDSHDSINRWSFDMTEKQQRRIEQFEDRVRLKVKDDFCCFSAVTNITNSRIEIIAKSMFFIVE